MLVSQRRQNAYHFQPPPPIDIPTTSSQPQPTNTVFDNPLLPTPPLYTPQPLDQKLLQSYLASTAQLPYSNSVLLPETPNVEQYMTTTFAYPQPDIRIQQSTPTPQYDVQYEPQYAPSPISIDSAIGLDCYPYEAETPMSGSSLQTPGFAQQSRAHQRFPSSSSVASSTPASPRNPHGLAAPHMRSYSNSDYTPPVSATLKFESSQDDTSGRFSNHLPTPTDTPLQDSFAANPQYQNLNFSGDSMDSAMAATMAYNNGLMMDNSNNGDDDVPGFSHSARHSVSSYGHDSPATPHTTSGDDFDDGFKVPHNDIRPNLPNVPKFDRTMSDIYQDELYNPQNMNTAPVSVAPKPKLNTKLLSPFRSSINERLQAAQSARSQSPSSVTSGGVSPFRQGSPLAPSNSFGSPLGLHVTGQQREQTMAEARRTALRQQQQQQQTQAEPKTISPKEAMLDYQPSAEDAKMPLFPDEASDYASQYSQATSSFGNATQGNYDKVADQKFSNLSTPNENSWSGSSRASSANYSQTPTSVPSQPTFNFSAPSQSQAVHGMPFQDQYHLATNETPEFPAHLTSMESSASEAPPASSQGSNGHCDIQRPKSTQANGGTYTCTYHGCSQRFETPQKLQKHKREGHRQNATPVTPDVGSGMTSAALLARNSQAGPHKCDRINPTTGKPCNTIFSRPYDLTRHEDTIHNARKQKVRCALCVEEKTFSRNDALTRHMRVVHPEVDFPGKHRRRGAHD